MNEFDITRTYAKGDHVLFDNKEYVYEPKDRHQNQSFSIGLLPIYGFGWKSKPNEPTVLDCKDKMINEI